jgi:hypothetical protein
VTDYMSRLPLPEQLEAYMVIREADAIGLINWASEEAVERGDLTNDNDIENDIENDIVNARAELRSLKEAAEIRLGYFRRRAGLED